MSHFSRAAAIITGLGLVLGACVTEIEEDVEQVEETELELRACLAIGLCVEGYTWSEKACRCLPNGGGQECTEIGLCVEGYVWDQNKCACMPIHPGGEPCGDSVCGAGQYCCNASCGICAPEGSYCIQIACL